MKNQNTKLDFRKQSVVELDKAKMSSINGGTSDALDISSCICPIIFQTLTIA